MSENHPYDLLNLLPYILVSFVKVGDKVKRGQTLCIVEAMKLMNEIMAEVDGEIVEICVANGQVVDYGSPLFRIRER